MNKTGFGGVHRKITNKYAKYIGSSGQDEGYHETYRLNGKDIEVYPPHSSEDGLMGWQVIYDGTFDFEGNKTQLLKRYPELRPHKVKVGSKSFKI